MASTRVITFDLNDQNRYQATMRASVQTLEAMRGRSDKPEQLEWEIRFYKWLLEQKAPESTCERYINLTRTLRDKFGTKWVKDKVATSMGYKEPCPRDK